MHHELRRTYQEILQFAFEIKKIILTSLLDPFNTNCCQRQEYCYFHPPRAQTFQQAASLRAWLSSFIYGVDLITSLNNSSLAFAYHAHL